MNSAWCSQTPPKTRCRVYCERLTRLIAERLVGFALSIGVAQAGPAKYGDPDEIIRRADIAMYEAKRLSKAAAIVAHEIAFVPAGSSEPASAHRL